MINLLRTPALRRPLLLMLGAILLGTSLFHLSLSTRLASEDTMHRQAERAQQAERDARLAPTRLAHDTADAALYLAIERSGFAASENRVGWISALSHAQTQLELDSLSWRMGPRTPSALAPGLGYTPMDIATNTRHFSRLEALLELLRTLAPGRFTVEHCALTMNPDGITGEANCRLNWWTLQDGGAETP